MELTKKTDADRGEQSVMSFTSKDDEEEEMIKKKGVALGLHKECFVAAIDKTISILHSITRRRYCQPSSCAHIQRS